MPFTLVVAGATGWLGGHVVEAAVRGGVKVLALVRPGTDTAPLEARAAAAATAPGLLSIARLDLAAPGAAAAVEAALREAAGTSTTDRPMALINVVGVRDLAVPEVAIRRVLTGGTLALWQGCVSSGRVARFVSIAGGIHRDANGAPNRTMVHNRAREDALAVAVAQARAADGSTPLVSILDPSVFFKDAAAIFGMIASKNPPALTLIRGGWSVLCAPISGRDLAGELVRAALQPLPSPSPSPVTRYSVGGPQALTFGELADAAAGALVAPGSACRRVTLSRPVAWAAWKAAAVAGACGSKKALGLARFLSFLWVVCTDETPGGLVGEVSVGEDTVEGLFRELAAERRRGAG